MPIRCAAHPVKLPEINASRILKGNKKRVLLMQPKKVSDTDFPIAEDRHEVSGRISLVVVVGIGVFLCLCLLPIIAFILTR